MKNPITLDNLDEWYLKECDLFESSSYTRVLKEIGLNFDQYICFPKKALLLWNGCTRIKYHKFPDELKATLKKNNVKYNLLSNGPAISAYELAKGLRPFKQGNSKHGWSVHHLYNNKFPYFNKKYTLHAVKDGNHFTQSAGLVAIHPVADALFEELDIFAWYIRAKAYLKFGYDPDQVFNPQSSYYGFADATQFTVICKEPI